MERGTLNGDDDDDDDYLLTLNEADILHNDYSVIGENRAHCMDCIEIRCVVELHTESTVNINCIFIVTRELQCNKLTAIK